MRDPLDELKSDLAYMAATAFYIIAFLMAVAGILIGCVLSADNARSQERVDVALVLAVDHSNSVDQAEWRLQMEGYAEAFESDAVQQSIWSGAYQRIAVYMFRWSGDYVQETMIQWRIVDSPESASDLAAEIRSKANLTSFNATCISGAILFAGGVFEAMPFEAERMVLDISGDEAGYCQHHPYWPAKARDEVVAKGVTINGLPILTDSPTTAGGIGYNSNVDLERFYKENVIGGPGAFIIPSMGFSDFGRAVQRKLMQEIAAL